MLHQNYGWEAVEKLPLSLLPKVLIEARKKETEKMMYPMWLVHVIQSTINKTEVLPLDQFITGDITMKETTKSAEEIKLDLMPLVEIYKKVRR